MASNCGLGWALQAGGSISRTIKSLPDEGGYYALHGVPPIYASGDGSDTGPRFDTYNKDTEPDLFYFSVNGYSGKFVIDKYHRIQLIPEQDIKIVMDTTAMVPLFTKWIITTPAGVQYQFQDVFDTNESNGTPFAGIPLAWHLTKVITTTQDTISFQYREESYRNRVNDHSPIVATGYTNGGCPQCMTKPMLNIFGGHALSKVSSRNNEVIFNYKTTVREDNGSGL